MKFTTINQAKKQTGFAYLGGINKSSKMIKNDKVSKQYTYILYLAPANQSGYNVCKFATSECRSGCLNTSGRAAMEILSKNENRIINSSIRKTKMFFENRDFFMQWLIAEIKFYEQKAIKDGYGFSVRLNGTSDINWSEIFYKEQTVFQIFSHIQFYDYTKDYTKFFNVPKNYHLTFSYTGYNIGRCNLLLKLGYNVAVIFNSKELPETFNGFKVINGDLTDYRPNDGDGVIVGLKWKKIANKVDNERISKSIFVIQKNNIACEFKQIDEKILTV